MQSVPITTNIVHSNQTAHDEVYLIQHYVIMTCNLSSNFTAHLPSSSSSTPAMGPPSGNRYGRPRGRGMYIPVEELF
jgi:hypothetical protein